jgi:hypothetical protein
MTHEYSSSNSIHHALRVSVVLNVWGKDDETSLIRSLNSIERQKQKPDELLIVIDGPISEGLQKVLQDFRNMASFPVIQIDVPITGGLWNARNIGIQAAKYEFVAVHDADDVMHPDRLRIQLEQIGSAEIDILGSPVYEFDADTEKVLGLRSLAVVNQVSSKMLWQNVINHSSVMLRKSAVISVGGYRNVYLSEDYDLWLRLIGAGKNITTNEFVLQAFSVDSQLSKRRGGIRFVSAELTLHRLIRATHEQSLLISWARLLLRLIFRLGPRFLRQSYRTGFQAKKSQNIALNLDEFLTNSPLNINLYS